LAKTGSPRFSKIMEGPLYVFLCCVMCLGSALGQGLSQGFQGGIPISLLMSSAGDNNNNGGGLGSSYSTLQNLVKFRSLERRLQALETNVKSGAYGGCESGILGPMSPTQNRGTIRFQGYFMTAPTLQLSSSDLTTANANEIVSFKIRPVKITPTEAQVILQTPPSGGNIQSLYIAYSACPSNSNVAVPTSPEMTSPAASIYGNNPFSFNSNDPWKNPFYMRLFMNAFTS